MWQPVQPQGSLTDRIVAQIERLIDERRLAPGDRLPAEREMAALLSVSRPSLREATRVLESRGRLAVRHGQGVFVRPGQTETELRRSIVAAEVSSGEVFAMREVLEVPAASWAAQVISPNELRELRTTLDNMGRLLDAASRNGALDPARVDFDRLAALDAGFHLAIAAAAGNRFLRQTSGVLHDILLTGMETTLTIPGRAELSRIDHDTIYKG
ncbi:MAG: FadR/GntR family transcriptional regulator, partial [Mycobacteriales bacterium]